jgi:hypothetical protein
MGRIIALYICGLLLTFNDTYAKDWRGIVPLHSTCEDVKRLLGVSRCDPPVFNLESEIVNITFSEKPCADGWNVPAGTVISLTVFPKKKSPLTDLHLDLKAYEKAVSYDQPDITYYLNAEEGIVIKVTPDGKVDSITHGPAAKDNHLRYPNSLAEQLAANTSSHGTIKFDEYGHIPISEEHKRLDNFALMLRDAPNEQGFIIAYAGLRAREGEAQAMAERARNYMVNTRNIESARLTTVDGGYRKEMAVELFVGAKGVAAPVPSPTVCPSEVQIIKAADIKNNNRRSARPRRRR